MTSATDNLSTATLTGLPDIAVGAVSLSNPTPTAGQTVNVSAEIDGFAPFAILSLPAGPVELFAKAGYLFYDVEFEVDDLDVGDSSDEDLVYGAGIGLTLFDHLHARLEYEIIDISDLDESNALWLSGAWRF